MHNIWLCERLDLFHFRIDWIYSLWFYSLWRLSISLIQLPWNRFFRRSYWLDLTAILFLLLNCGKEISFMIHPSQCNSILEFQMLPCQETSLGDGMSRSWAAPMHCCKCRSPKTKKAKTIRKSRKGES